MKMNAKRIFDINKIDIRQLNIDFEIALKSTSLVLSDKLKIALVLIERMKESTVDILIETIINMNVLNDVLISLLKEASQNELSYCKQQFIEKSISNLNIYIYNQILNNLEPLNKNIYIMNTINICTHETINNLINEKCESLVFNIFRKTTNQNLKLYIKSLINKFENKNIRYYLNKD